MTASESPDRPRLCPRCGRSEVVELLYGFPTDEMFAAAQRGAIALGGCVIDDYTRSWECKRCKARFNSGSTEWVDPKDRPF